MAPRDTAQRKVDVLEKLDREKDAWVASAGVAGDAYLVPLSFHWDDRRLTFATLAHSLTVRNLRRAGRTRVALGPTRDVVIIEGPLEFVAADAQADVATAFAARLLWDPRREPREYVFFRLTPRRIQAWREENELAGRDVMVDGAWLA